MKRQILNQSRKAMNLSNIITEYWPKPIPIRNYDWQAWVDGREESGQVGQGATEDAAVEDLLEQIDEEL